VGAIPTEDSVLGTGDTAMTWGGKNHARCEEGVTRPLPTCDRFLRAWRRGLISH